MRDVLHISITPFQVDLVVKKCNGKLDCLIYEMLFIKNKRPCLKTQSDYIRAKLSSFTCTLFITSHHRQPRRTVSEIMAAWELFLELD